MISELLVFLLSLAPQIPAIEEPVRVGGEVPAPARLTATPPVYPEQARQAWVQGVVILELVVDKTGKVEDVRVLRSIPLLDDAAVAAVEQWEYQPTEVGGQPVSVVMTTTLNFTLPGGDEWTVVPEGDSELRLETYQLSIANDGSRTYTGAVRNVSGAKIEDVRVALVYDESFISAEHGSSPSFDPPVKTKDDPPVYPMDALRRRTQGVVFARLLVGRNGKVEDVRILRGEPDLDEAVLQAVERWEYDPLEVDGTTVPFSITTKVDFKPGDIGVEESIAPEDIGVRPRAATIELGALEPDAAGEFTLAANPEEGARLDNVQLLFLAVEDGEMREVPTSRQLKTIAP